MLKAQGPMISEAGTDALIGSLDAGQSDHFGAERWMSKNQFADSERVPWHDMVTHGKFVLFAGGLGGRYAAQDWKTNGDPLIHGYGSDDYDGGNIEFWPNNYGTGTALAGIGGDKDTYDFNDIPNQPEIGYGAMQVHNWKDGVVVWVLNNFNSGNTVDAGIGNNEFNGNPDWTFMGNGMDYRTRRLTIYVK